MELISLVRPEHGPTLSRRLGPRGGYKSVIDSEHHDVCTLTRLSFKSQMYLLRSLVTLDTKYFRIREVRNAKSADQYEYLVTPTRVELAFAP